MTQRALNRALRAPSTAALARPAASSAAVTLTHSRDQRVSGVEPMRVSIVGDRGAGFLTRSGLPTVVRCRRRRYSGSD